MNEDELVNDFTIFKYLPPKDNCIFSNLKGYDLQELFVLENKYQLELRDSINLDCDNTFGLEMEFEGINTVTTRLLLERYFSELWPVRCDSSLERGAEINSPILVDNKANWQMLKKICNAVLKNANNINTNISFKNAEVMYILVLKFLEVIKRIGLTFLSYGRLMKILFIDFHMESF